MPHQCLKCGSLFPEGTTTILRGCPDCRGTRFFFTQEPLTLSERDRMLQQADRDLPALLEQLTRPAPPTPSPPGPGPFPTPDPRDRLRVPAAFEPPRGEGRLLPDGRLLVRIPRDLKARVRRAATGWDYEAPAAAPTQPTAPAPAATLRAPPAAAVAPAPATPADAPIRSEFLEADPRPRNEQTAPETVRIEDLGRYEIDVQRLLEKSPIVVQRDGSYLIHLPSLFEMPRKKGPG